MKHLKFLMAALPLLCISLCATAKDTTVSIDLSWGKLCGSLMVPDTGSRTAVLIIAGSGPTDRNGNSALGVAGNSYYLLAKAFEEHGIASLRYDKRGIGASKLGTDAKESDLCFDDYINDARACIDYLRSEGYEKIVLAGHSEGSLIALCAAKDNPEVAAVISLAGAGYPIGDIMKLQLGNQLATTMPGLLLGANSVIDKLAQGNTVEKIPQGLENIFRQSVQPYLISWMKYDPRNEIRNLGIPILIINGDNDQQVTVDNADELQKANPAAKKVIIKNMTHPLKDSDKHDIKEQMTSVYMNSNLPLSEELVTVVTDFTGSL